MDPLLIFFICIGILAGVVLLFFLLSILVLIVGAASFPDDLNDDIHIHNEHNENQRRSNHR